jgi:pimeloyl-ACP methyl ester carboxylesterase
MYSRLLACAADGVEHFEVRGPLDNAIACLALGPEDGPLVIMLHGFPDSAVSWTPAMRVFARLGFRAVAVDMRGFGNSDMPTSGWWGALPSPVDAPLYSAAAASDDVMAVIDQLESTGPEASAGRRKRAGLKPLLVGHDLGGQSAWYLAASQPHRFSAAVIAASPHPGLMKRNLGPSQLLRSYYMALFNLPWIPVLAAAQDKCRMIASVFADPRPAAELPPPLAAALSPACPRTREQCGDWWRLSGAATHKLLFPPEAKAAAPSTTAESTTGPDVRASGIRVVTAMSAASVIAIRRAFARPGRLAAAFGWYRAIFWPPSQTHARLLSLENRLELPVVSLAPEHDVALGMELVSRSGTVLKHGCAALVNGATHWVHLERPASVAASALELLQWAGLSEGLPEPAKAALEAAAVGAGGLGEHLTSSEFAESGFADPKPPPGCVDAVGRPLFRQVAKRIYAPVFAPKQEGAADVGAVALAVKAALGRVPAPPRGRK